MAEQKAVPSGLEQRWSVQSSMGIPCWARPRQDAHAVPRFPQDVWLPPALHVDPAQQPCGQEVELQAQDPPTGWMPVKAKQLVHWLDDGPEQVLQLMSQGLQTPLDGQ